MSSTPSTSSAWKGSSTVTQLAKYSMGIGDRFGRQGRAQLAAFVAARAQGLDVTPVWNKSHREHIYIGSDPGSVRREADEAVAALGWIGPYHVDADHIGLKNVDLFVESSDFLHARRGRFHWPGT